MKTVIVKKLLFIIILGATFYIAGMYRQMPLMVMAVMEWILLVFLFFLSRYLRRKTKFSFLASRGEAKKGNAAKCRIRIENRGRFALRQVSIQLRIYNDEDKLVEKSRIYQNVEALDRSMDVEITPPCCGILRVQLYRTYVYDYLTVFSAARRLKEEMELLVLPNVPQLQTVSLIGDTAARYEEAGQKYGMRYFGSDSREISQIREYRMGDIMRYIHWNQSAKMGTLWMKEFEREDEAFLDILLDLMIPDGWKREEAEDFYVLISALILGFIQDARRVSVSWYHTESDGFVKVLVENPADYKSMMDKLYRTGFVVKNETVKGAYEKEIAASDKRLLKFNLCLECYEVTAAGEEELRHRFTHEELNEC